MTLGTSFRGVPDGAEKEWKGYIVSRVVVACHLYFYVVCHLYFYVSRGVKIF
jgi:hypothetical protein